MILLYHLIPKMFTLLILCRRLLFYDGFRQKTHFLKCYTLIYFYFLTRSLNCLWILTWVQKPICCSRAGVLHKVYCFSRPTKKVYHEVYIFQIPLLCYKWQQLFMPLYIRYGFSNCQRCIFCCTPYKWTKYQKKILIYFRILWCHFIRCFNPTWTGDLIKKKKKAKKKNVFWLWPSIILFHSSPFFFLQNLSGH